MMKFLATALLVIVLATTVNGACEDGYLCDAQVKALCEPDSDCAYYGAAPKSNSEKDQMCTGMKSHYPDKNGVYGGDVCCACNGGCDQSKSDSWIVEGIPGYPKGFTCEAATYGYHQCVANPPGTGGAARVTLCGDRMKSETESASSESVSKESVSKESASKESASSEKGSNENGSTEGGSTGKCKAKGRTGRAFTECPVGYKNNKKGKFCCDEDADCYCDDIGGEAYFPEEQGTAEAGGWQCYAYSNSGIGKEGQKVPDVALDAVGTTKIYCEDGVKGCFKESGIGEAMGMSGWSQAGGCDAPNRKRQHNNNTQAGKNECKTDNIDAGALGKGSTTLCRCDTESLCNPAAAATGLAAIFVAVAAALL